MPCPVTPYVPAFTSAADRAAAFVASSFLGNRLLARILPSQRAELYNTLRFRRQQSNRTTCLRRRLAKLDPRVTE